MTKKEELLKQKEEIEKLIKKEENNESNNKSNNKFGPFRDDKYNLHPEIEELGEEIEECIEKFYKDGCELGYNFRDIYFLIHIINSRKAGNMLYDEEIENCL